METSLKLWHNTLNLLLSFSSLLEKLKRRFRVEYKEATRKYCLNQWTEIIRECRSSGQTVSAWCAEHDINPKSHYYWLRRVREAAYKTHLYACWRRPFL